MSEDLSPSAKAWQTAKDRAVAEYESRQQENRVRGEVERQEMIRALMDPNLSHGAARFFCLLLKAGWLKEFGGLYQDRVGSIFRDGRTLASYCGGASVNCLYRKTRSEKRDPKGKLLRAASETLGWIDELVRGGYIWVSKHRIPNIPKAKWPNVYNVACHVPHRITPHLPWGDGSFGSENIVNTTLPGGCSRMENTIFDASDTAGDRETPENTLGNHRNGGQPVTEAEDGQSPNRRIANHRNGGRAITEAEDGQSPERRIANHRNGGQAVTGAEDGQGGDPVHLRETLGSKPDLDSETGGEPHPTDQALEDYKLRWKGPPGHPTHVSKLEKEFERVRTKLMNGGDREFWKVRSDFIRELLDGGKPPKAPAKSALPTPTKPKPTPAELEAIRAAAKKHAADYRKDQRLPADKV